MADADPQNHDDNDIDMEKPCEICGDIGFINAIRDCSLCQITREHAYSALGLAIVDSALYCMKVMLEAEADAWICEECVSAKVALSSPAPNKQPEDARAIFMIKKPPQNTKVKYITPEEVRALESRAMKNDSILESKTHLSPRSSIAKASFCQRGLSALVSNSSAKPGPQIGVTGFEVSLNGESLSGSSPNKQFSTSEEEPHLEKNVSTADPCTFGDLVKDNSEKYGIHPVHTSFQLVQCLPAVDLATMKKLKFRNLWSTFSHERESKNHSQCPEECRAKMSKTSSRKQIDVASNSKGEKRVQKTSKTTMMPPTKSQRTQEPTKLVSKNVCLEEPTDSSEADSDKTLINRMHKRKPKVPEVNLKVNPMPREDEFKEDDFDGTPLAHHKCKRKLKMNRVISRSKSSREEEFKEDDSGETPLIYRIRKRKRKVNVVYSESESSPAEDEDEDELEKNYSKEPRNGLSVTETEDGYAIADDLISSIVFEEDHQLLDSMGDRVLEALYQSVKSAMVMAASSIQSIKMSYPLKEGHANLKDLEEEQVKLKALRKGVQSGCTLLKDGIKKKLVLIDQFWKQVEEKLAEWEGRLLRAMSFVNQEFSKAINEGKLKLQVNQGVQLMQRNQESLLEYQRGKKVAHRHLQSTVLEMFPSLDWSLVEANYQALVDAEEAKVAQEEKSLRSSTVR